MAFRSSRRFLAATISLAIFTDIFLYGVVPFSPPFDIATSLANCIEIIPVLPHSLTQRAHISPLNIQYWCAALLAAYGFGLFPASILCGWAIDQISSRRVVLLFGLIFIASSTLLLCLSRTIVLFVVGRVLQGIAAAVVWSSGLALLLNAFGKEEFPRAMGIVLMSQSMALVVGPLVGGFVFDRYGYNAVFLVCFMPIAIDIGMQLIMLERCNIATINVEHQDANGERNHIEVQPNGAISREQITASTETTLLIGDRKEASEAPWLAFYYMLLSPRILADLWHLATITAMWSTYDAILPLKMKTLFGSNSFHSGLVLLPLVLPAFLAPLVGKLSERYGSRVVAILLLILRIPASACLSFVERDTLFDLILLYVLLFFSGLALNLVTPYITSHLIQSIEDLEQKYPGVIGARGASGRGFGLANCAFALGTMIGPAVSAIILENAGWRLFCWALGAFNGVVLLLFVSLPYN